MTGHEYFIENYLKIRHPDGTFTPITLTDAQKDFIKLMEDAKKSGRKLQILKKKRRLT